MASPVHHTAQVAPKPGLLTAPESSRTTLPKVALMVTPTRAAAMIAAASPTRSSSRWKSSLRSNSADATGASVLPAAITAAPAGDGPRGRFTAKAASRIAGQARRPITSSATSAIPDGGQTGVTWPWNIARLRLRLAATTYASHTRTSGASLLVSGGGEDAVHLPGLYSESRRK